MESVGVDKMKARYIDLIILGVVTAHLLIYLSNQAL